MKYFFLSLEISPPEMKEAFLFDGDTYQITCTIKSSYGNYTEVNASHMYFAEGVKLDDFTEVEWVKLDDFTVPSAEKAITLTIANLTVTQAYRTFHCKVNATHVVDDKVDILVTTTLDVMGKD